ncbi:uncharacterized protein PV09_01930 [Verruconis gallopava]|uniref:WW domain-containing protein n=1 Tax=Verruconis gallopava TaxID=253628 RepID=A0A0D1XWD2_9PEZI|nr:uncharacterized protein PV09_01930 [Verruconis gallopava]KIW07036.1 hypothetical protein PV09_01930 [Verruconis gallopava]
MAEDATSENEPKPSTVPAESEDGEIHEGNAPPSEKPAGSSDENAPPLPDEEPPPLPNEPTPEDDGWQPVWDDSKQAWYFYNRFTGKSQWENPRVPEATASIATGPASDATAASSSAATRSTGAAGGYNPAIHGDYDPNADYALANKDPDDDIDYEAPTITDPSQLYAQAGSFNRFTGKWQAADLGPERHSDAEKARRQMRAIFDVDAAANSHDGRSLKEERRNRKLTKEQIKAFNDKRRAKKEEKRRAWLKD